MTALALLNGTEPSAAPAPAPAPAPFSASMGGLSANMLGLALGGGRCSVGGGGRASMDSSGEGGRVSMGSVGSGTSSDSASSGTSLKRLGLSGAASRRVVATAEPAAPLPDDAAAKDRTDASVATPNAPAAAKPGKPGKPGADSAVDALTAAMSGASLAPGVAAPPALDAIEEDSPSKEDLTPQAAARAALSPIAPSAAQQARGMTPRASGKTPRRGFGMPATPVHPRQARASEMAGPTPPVDGPMLAWWLVMASLPTEEALLLLPLVCRTMRAMGDDLALLASLVGSFFVPGASDGGAKRAGSQGVCSLVEIAEVLKAYPCGRYLAEGGCKQVYRVFNGSAQRWEAMSVVDRKALREAGIEGQLQTEVWVSYLLAQLRRHGRCPHFLSLHQTFTCVEPPPGREWGDVDKPPAPAAAADDGGDDGSSSDESDEAAAAPPPAAAGRAKPRKPAKVTRRPKAAQECHQYLLMELAEGGDMEEACKKQPGEAWEPSELPGLLLQMLFSLLASQRELGMRHYDIKLLNFFLARPPCKAEAAGAPALTMRYGVGGAHPLLQTQLPSDAPSMVVLADFGTADLAPETLGAPIGEQHFTTLENTPPDFLLCGSGARQGFAADAFGLGLCVLHLLTGRAPYEELTAPLHCPAELRQALGRVWSVEAAASADDDPYGALRCHVEDDEGETTLCDTLYRFLCLFGAELDAADAADGDGDDADRDTHACSGCVASSAAWAAVQAWLATTSGKSRFGRDHAQWSIFHGRSKVLAPAQKRMAALPGSEELLRGLVRFEPSRRWSVSRALRSDFFAPLRCNAAASPTASETVLEYLQYQEA